MSAVLRPVQILLVGQKIRQIRKSRHLTQADVASRIGVTQSDLSRMENGEYKVGLDTLFKILQIFELPMSRFFEEPIVDPSGAPGSSAEGALSASGTPHHEEPTPAEEDRERLLSDWSVLSDEARHEVLEFVTFKRLQQRSTRPRWKPDVEKEAPQAPETDAGAGRVDRGPWAAPEPDAHDPRNGEEGA